MATRLWTSPERVVTSLFAVRSLARSRGAAGSTDICVEGSDPVLSVTDGEVLLRESVDWTIFGRRRSVAEPHFPSIVNALSRLERRAYSTYKSRLRAYERLNRRNNAWNASLIALATATTVAAVGMLVDKEMYGKQGDSLMVALAILSLVASLVVSSVNYGVRSRAMESSYKRIQQIAYHAENLRDVAEEVSFTRFQELHKEYEIALEASENHSSADFHRFNESDWLMIKRRTWRDSVVSLAPYVTLIVPVLILVPFVRWYLGGL
ncbi:SLATT domain-containing protein [Pseudonocardia halophobica]|uniref:SLATT domain-containing protein n=1 Tax=Pseudonocardia halophobica TaxID=29401 RepID=UPI003D8B77B0